MTTMTLDQKMLQNCQEELRMARDEIHRLNHQHANDEAANKMILAEIHRLKVGFDRYEALRKLNTRQFSELYARNLAGERFDDMVDALVKR